MTDTVLKTAKEKMAKTCAVYERDMQSVRAGRANPQVLDRIMVDYYGTPTPIGQVGNISVPEARMLVIAPWEPKMITPIEKAIQTSDLGLNPSNDGKVIRLVFPELNEERRKDLTKQASRAAEEAKVAVRAIRRDAMEQIKKMKKNSEITEDDQRKAEEDLPAAARRNLRAAFCPKVALFLTGGMPYGTETRTAVWSRNGGQRRTNERKTGQGFVEAEKRGENRGSGEASAACGHHHGRKRKMGQAA